VQAVTSTILPATEERARRSKGISASAIYLMVTRALEHRHKGGSVLLDVGCGTGRLWAYVGDRFDHYLGADAVRYDGFPEEGTFFRIDLNRPLPLEDNTAGVVTAVETIEHLENPRAFFRELVRLTRPGGWVIVTTPNQLSLLSKLTLVLKNQFNAFQQSSYPAHLTALLEIDLRRMAIECSLTEVDVAYSGQGRLAFTGRHVPGFLSRMLPRAFSDNILLIGRKSTS
jgi:SAM-dependent methyltransferase